VSTLPLALTFYSVVVSFHVIFAIIGIGTGFSFPFLGAKAKNSPENLPFTLDTMLTIQVKWIQPMATLVLLTGLYQVWKGPYSFSDDQWLGIAFALFAIYMGLLGAVTIKGTRRALEIVTEAKAAGTPPGPDLGKILERNGKVGPLMGLLIVTITFLMEAKPF
jgi:hypothetical protein